MSYPNEYWSAPLPPPESLCDGHVDKEDNDSDEEEEPPSFTESSSDGDSKEEEPLSEPLPRPRPHPFSTSQCADFHRESKIISCAIG